MKSATILSAALIVMALQTQGAKAETTIGRAHTCQPESLREDVEGMTRVSFVITLDGRIKDPAVSETSGNPEVDNASLRCVRIWKYKPALRDGVPFAVTWSAYIAWNPKTPPDITQLLRDCAKDVSSKYPSAVENEGTTTFAVRYENFKITAASVEQPGGVKDVDEAEAACLANTTPEPRERVIVHNRVDYSQTNNTTSPLRGASRRMAQRTNRSHP